MKTERTGSRQHSGAASAGPRAHSHTEQSHDRRKLETLRRDLLSQRGVAKRRRARAPVASRRPHENHMVRLDKLIAEADRELARRAVDFDRIERLVWVASSDYLTQREEEARRVSERAGTAEERADAEATMKTLRSIRECLLTQAKALGVSMTSSGSRFATAQVGPLSLPFVGGLVR